MNRHEREVAYLLDGPDEHIPNKMMLSFMSGGSNKDNLDIIWFWQITDIVPTPYFIVLFEAFIKKNYFHPYYYRCVSILLKIARRNTYIDHRIITESKCVPKLMTLYYDTAAMDIHCLNKILAMDILRRGMKVNIKYPKSTHQDWQYLVDNTIGNKIVLTDRALIKHKNRMHPYMKVDNTSYSDILIRTTDLHI